MQMGSQFAMGRRFKAILQILVLGVVSFGLAGCSWQQPKPQKMDWHGSDAAQATVDLPAQQAVDAVRKAVAEPPLSLPVDSAAEGSVVTGWKEYPGDLHIVRRWAERTRFRISVTPDFSNPAGRCRLRVEDQTEEKPSSNQPWYPAPNSRRPERSAEVLRQIVDGVTVSKR